MAKTLLNDLSRYAGRELEGGIAMAEVMHPDRRKASLLQQAAKLLPEHRAVSVCAVAPGEDEAPCIQPWDALSASVDLLLNLSQPDRGVGY